MSLSQVTKRFYVHVRPNRCQPGAILLLSMIFLVVFAALAVAILSQSAGNLQVAANHHKANLALAAAESGLQVVRYYLSHIKMPSSTPPSQYFNVIMTELSNDLESQAEITLNTNGSIPDVVLDSTTNQRFSVTTKMDDTNSNLIVSVVGKVGQEVARTIQVGFAISPYKHPIFKYGMASKGPIDFTGNSTITGASANWEADLYTESLNLTEWDVAVHLGGNANFDGNIDIGGNAQFVYDADLVIAGDQGQMAVDSHVTKNVGPVDFPAPDTARFVKYADPDSSAIIDGTTDLSKGMTLTNATIAANTNPVFQKGVTIEGILLVEAPNIVTFDNVVLQGIIVGHGSAGDPSTNQLHFTGNFASTSYPSGAEFDAIKQEVGTAILAPGFAASFTGNFSAVDGVIAVNGLHMNANANASVEGSIVNYSETASTIAGNVALAFDRANITEIPAGFDTHRVLAFDNSTYSLVF